MWCGIVIPPPAPFHNLLYTLCLCHKTPPVSPWITCYICCCQLSPAVIFGPALICLALAPAVLLTQPTAGPTAYPQSY